MKTMILLFAILLSYSLATAQPTDNFLGKYIEVTGSAEMEIEPDEIRFIIGIEEYWEEEFNRDSKFEDYKTKVPIKAIENDLMKVLTGIGIQKENIFVREIGNYWRYKGKEFLVSKQIELILQDFKVIDKIIDAMDNKGIDYMRIGSLINKDITKYRKQVKAEALIAAKEKAAYLLETLGKSLGDVMSITEIEDDRNYWSPPSLTSNTIMSTPDNSSIGNLRKIKLRYEIKAKFGIKGL